jgi:hypothetical protein
MTVTFVKTPIKPVAVKITYAEQPRQKNRVFKSYDAKGRPLFVDKDEPDAKE